MSDEQKEPMAFPPLPLSGLCVMCSASGRITFTSMALRALLEEDPIGRNLNDYLEDRTTAALIAETQAGREYPFERETLGHRFSCVAYPVEESIRIDLTPLAKVESPFVTLNASRFLTREINEDLSLMLPALLRLEGDLPEGRRDSAAVLKRGIFRLMRLTRNVEDCAAAENHALIMHFTKEDLTGLCAGLAGEIEPLCAGMDIRLVTRLPEEALLAWVDRDKLTRMILNLLSNAIAAHRGEEGGAVVLSLKTDREMYAISVTDNGRGFDPEVMESRFRKFDQLDPREYASGGAGFGLTLVRAFAEKHGGGLMITSGPGGSTARILLPVGWEPPEREDLSLRSPISAYGTGINPVLVELSTVLDRKFYRKGK